MDCNGLIHTRYMPSIGSRRVPSQAVFLLSRVDGQKANTASFASVSTSWHAARNFMFCSSNTAARFPSLLPRQCRDGGSYRNCAALRCRPPAQAVQGL